MVATRGGGYSVEPLNRGITPTLIAQRVCVKDEAQIEALIAKFKFLQKQA